MPTYLCHGFRWQRQSIRVYVVVQDLDDASPDSIISRHSSQCILDSFYRVFDFLPDCQSTTPKTSSSRAGSRNRSTRTRSQSRPPASATCGLTTQSWSAVKLLEEYDPNDLSAVSRPYAYVADYAVRIDLSAAITDHITAYENRVSSKSSSIGGSGEWFPQLRDQLQRDEKIQWYILVNGDEVRETAHNPDSSLSLLHYSSDNSSSRTSRAGGYKGKEIKQPTHTTQGDRDNDNNDDDDDDEKRSIKTAKALESQQQQQQQQNPDQNNEVMNQYNYTLQHLLFAENQQQQTTTQEEGQPLPPPPPPEKDYHSHKPQPSLGARDPPPQSGQNSNSKPRSGLKRLFGRGRSTTSSDG